MEDLVLVFELGDLRFGLDASCVATIDPLPPLTHIPILPAYCAGICSLRGNVVPVVDLAKLWHIPHDGDYTCILLLRHSGKEIAILADKLLKVENSHSISYNIDAGDGLNRYVAARLPDKTAILHLDLLFTTVYERTDA